ncbi:hypothetical protein RND81_05G183600 [Saponaria officinalis]|uniref:VQ domain-containing protein n=1 Tax=Saponaria officinalis TaxID=3572 RepID=A0AAW1KZH5_SAPOF
MSSENIENPSITISKRVSDKQLLVAKNKSSKKSTTKAKVISNNKRNNNNNNQPLKVVYISNPIKFKVNADEFQALVQGLTGRDATEWTDCNNNNNHNHHNNYLGEEVSPVDDSGLDQDDEVIEVQHEPLMDDDQVQMDGYDGSSEINLDYFGPFDGDDEDKGHMISYNYGGFPSIFD